MSTLPLTEKQERLWRFIKSCERSPTYREMEAALGRGRGRLSDTITALAAKGYVSYVPNLARSIVALDPNINLAGIRTSELLAEIERRLMSGRVV